MAAKHNITLVVTSPDNFEEFQALLTDLTDKQLIICIISFGRSAILNYCNGDTRIFNDLVNKTDAIVESLNLEPESHGKELLKRLRTYLRI